MDAVDRPQFRVVKGVRVPPWWWSLAFGGHGLPVQVQCGASRGEGPWGGAKVSLRYVPRGGLLFLGHRTGCGSGLLVTGFLRDGGLCYFFVRSLGCPRRALVVALRPPRPGGLAVLQLGLCTGPVVRVAGAHLRDRCRRPLLARWGVERFVPLPPVRGVGRPRVPLAVCPRRAVPAAGRPPTLGGRRRTSWTHHRLPAGGLCGALPVALAALAWEWWGCAPARCGASWTGVRDRWQTMSVGRLGCWDLHE